MNRIYLTKLAIVTAILFCFNLSLLAQTTSTYNYTGSVQTYVVPLTGVTAVGVDASGAKGGSSSYGAPGSGGRVQCNLTVTPGQTLYIYVGQGGINGTGSAYNGGGGAGTYTCYGAGCGGGASDIRFINSPVSTYSSSSGASGYRYVVAGGGGGAGAIESTSNGGAGGGTTGGSGGMLGSYPYSACYGTYGGSQTGGGAAGTCGGYSGSFGVGAAGYYYSAGGGGGYYGGGSGDYYPGGGGGSSYTDPVLATNVTHTQGGSISSNANGVVKIITPNLGTILGNSPVCVGATLSLSSTGSGGTWSTTSTTITIGSGTGVVTGLSSGTGIVTYSASTANNGAGYITATVTVNPAPSPIIGASSVCVGSTTTLADGGGGTWSSSVPGQATIGLTSGVVTGYASGTPNITYTLPVTGCTIVAPFTVNATPGYISGPNNVCAGGANITLTDPNSGGSFTSSNTAAATITSVSGIVTGGTAGATNITYTLPTGCSVSTTISVNPLPSVITGSTNVCAGSATALGDAVSGGSWSSSNIGIASVGPTGITSGVAPGTATITYTLPTTCAITTSMLVNALPTAISGTASVCAGATTTLSDATLGGTWSINNPSLATIVPTSGAISSIASGTPIVSYTIPSTGCVTTVPLTINALPTAFSVTGGGGYCVGTGGTHVGLSLSAAGVTYKLYNGGATLVSTVVGSNAPIDFGLFSTNGTYTAVAINATTGCTNNMAGSAIIITNPLPNTYNVTGGGSYCPGGSGVNIYQSGSDVGVNYQLMVGGVPTGAAISGTGSSLSFGLQTAPGVYTVQAISAATGCAINMVGSPSVVINATPNIHNLNAGGSYCSGGTGIAVTLDGSDAGTNYQLYYGATAIGAVVPGTGSMLNFGLQTGAGNYTIVASSASTTCNANMNGTATITINPLPLVYFVTGGGSYCPGGPGVHVNLNFSNTGVNYQLYLGSDTVGSPIGGSSAGLDFGLQTTAGSYSVVATDVATGCSSNMSGSAVVSINSLPTLHTVTGGGNFCTGGTGVTVGLNGSNSGARYQLMFSGSPVGSLVTGTGGALNFGLQSGVGAYTVVATNISTSCTDVMTGAAVVGVNPLPDVDTIVAAGTSLCAGGAGIDISLSGSDVGVNYQLFRGGALVGTPMAGSGSSIDFGLHTLSGIYTIIGTNTITGCSSAMAGTAPISVNPAPAVYITLGGGNYCAGGSGVHVTLSGSSLNVNYQLNGPGGSVSTVAGSGSGLDFGLQTTAGAYTVVGTDAITGCSTTMAGSPAVTIVPLPTAYTVGGGGNYCMGGTGVAVSLSGSAAGIRYTLHNGAAAVGSYVTGTGAPISFSSETSAGNYTVVALNPSTTCTNTMTGSANIGINSLPAPQMVSGGGPYCAGGTGSDVSLAGSVAGVNYELVYSGVPGSPMAGSGAAIDFGLQTVAGTYTVLAIDTTTLCTSNMTGSATVTILPQPAIDTVTGGGGYCAGGPGESIHLNMSNSGIQYQLLLSGASVGGPVTGTGGAINFGLQTAPGTYTVLASPGGLCQTTMYGSRIINVTPLPTIYDVTGGGAFCASGTGVNVSLSGSGAGINYVLYKGGTSIGTFPGTGSVLNFGPQTSSGLYTVVATNSITGCTSPMSGSSIVSVLPAPAVFNVSGGGPYCEGGNGSDVLLNGSNTDVFYTLVQAGVVTTDSLAGTGTILDFGLQTTTSSTAYTVIARDAATNCTNNMADTATVSVLNNVVPSITTVTSSGGLTIKMGQLDTIKAAVTNGGTDGATYEWFIDGYPISGATNSMLISDQFANNDTVTCLATSTGMCGGQSVRKSIVLTVLNTEFVNQLSAGSSHVNVIPNPNNGVFVVSGSLGTNNDEEVSMEVLDVVGHVVYSGKAITHNGDINERIQLTGMIANGMYLLSLRSNSVSQVFHIVVEQ